MKFAVIENGKVTNIVEIDSDLVVGGKWAGFDLLPALDHAAIGDELIDGELPVTGGQTPPLQPQPIDPAVEIDRVITEHLNATARERGYRDIYTPVNALTSPLPQVSAEARALVDYYNNCWAYAILHQEEAAKYVIFEGDTPVAIDAAAVIADLPVFGS